MNEIIQESSLSFIKLQDKNIKYSLEIPIISFTEIK